MRKPRKTVLATVLVALAAIGIATVKISSVEVREIGRTDPKRAANYRLPWFNFSETYTDGEVLGIAIGSTREEAIDTAGAAGFTIGPNGWGDNRAGGAELYSRAHLQEMMRRQPYLVYYDTSNSKRAMIVKFRGNRVASIKVFYINFEAI